MVIPNVVIVKNEFDARRDVRKDVEHEEDDQEERREGMTTAGLGATHFAKRSRSHSIHKIYHKNTLSSRGYECICSARPVGEWQELFKAADFRVIFDRQNGFVASKMNAPKLSFDAK